MVSIAAERATKEDIEQLIETNEVMSMAIQKGMNTLEEDYEFHRLLFLATHNSVFKKVFDTISGLLKEGMAVNKLKRTHPKRNLEGVEEHSNIIKAIKNKDAIAARRQ
ncbi:FadR family transcriptional regulator [bacterium LRH843]|nr:FadR family transcriptional regulator [bacterium LRH843]